MSSGEITETPLENQTVKIDYYKFISEHIYLLTVL